MEQKEPLQKHFVASLALHGSVLALVALWGYFNGPLDRFGDAESTAGPGSVLTTPTIPIPSRVGPKNPVAEDTESLAEARQKPVEKKAEPDEPDAVALDTKKRPTKEKKKKTVASIPYRPKREQDLTKLYTQRSGRMVDNTYQMKGGGGVGLGPANVFGSRFGAYAQLLQERIAEKWNTDGVNAVQGSTNVASVAFEILRSGEVRDVRVTRSSGNYALDRSAERAVREASPLPPLPQGFERSSAKVELDFQYKR